MKSQYLAVYTLSICITLSSCHQAVNKRIKYFDLSYSFNNDTIYFPGQRQFELRKDYLKVRKPGFTYSSFSFCMGEHGGTHLDAPYHFDEDKWTVDKIPPENLIDVPAAVIDVENVVNQLETPNEFVLKVHHIIEHEQSHGLIPFGGVVLIHTGWSHFWPDKIKYLGWNNSTGEGTLSFPGISEVAAKWLADERQIVGIGLDTASIDPGNSKAYPTHVLLAKKNIYNLENVANLHLLPKEAKEEDSCSLHLFVMPLKIVGATGSPARILAYCK